VKIDKRRKDSKTDILPPLPVWVKYSEKPSSRCDLIEKRKEGEGREEGKRERIRRDDT